MGLLNEFQLQAIGDFKRAVEELLENMNDSAFDVADIEQGLDDVNREFVTVKALLTDTEDGKEGDSDEL